MGPFNDLVQVFQLGVDSPLHKYSYSENVICDFFGDIWQLLIDVRKIILKLGNKEKMIASPFNVVLEKCFPHFNVHLNHLVMF